MRDPRRQAGFALLMVLWGVALLSLLAITYNSQSRTGLSIAQQTYESAKQRQIALAASILVISELFKKSADRSWQPDGAAHDITFDEQLIRFRLQNEDGKVSINRANENLLARLFSQVAGVKSPAALAAAIADWRDTDDLVRLNGAESAVYRSAGLEAMPQNTDFLSLDELRGVFGMTSEIFANACQYLTPYSARTAPDPSVASRALQDILAGKDGDDIRPPTEVPMGSQNAVTAVAGLTRINGLTRAEEGVDEKTYSIVLIMQGVERKRDAVYYTAIQLNQLRNETPLRFIVPPRRLYDEECHHS